MSDYGYMYIELYNHIHSLIHTQLKSVYTENIAVIQTLCLCRTGNNYRATIMLKIQNKPKFLLAQ